MSFEENVLLKLKRKYSKDEYVSMLLKELSEVKFKNGELVSEIEELRRIPTSGGKTKRQWLQSEIFKDVHNENKTLKNKVRQLSQDVDVWRNKYLLEVQKNKKP